MNIQSRYKSDRMLDLLSDAEVDKKLSKSLLETVRARVAEVHHSPELIKRKVSSTLSVRRFPRPQAAGANTLSSKKVQAALAVTDAITIDGIDSFQKSSLEEALQVFDKGEVVRLVLAVLAANDWHYLHAGGPEQIPAQLIC